MDQGHPAPAASQADVVIVGGGPAGLAAAVYLGRYRRHCVVIDANDGRALLIPTSHNCPGFPDGISGRELVQRMRDQASRYGATLLEGTVSGIEPQRDGFRISWSGGTLLAAKAILATGVKDRVEHIPQWRTAVADGRLRLCPVCDGYEVIDQEVAVLGSSEHALREAMFIQAFTREITLVADTPNRFSDEVRRGAAEHGIAICEDMDELVLTPRGYEVRGPDSGRRRFDVLYPAFGCDIRSPLATTLGLNCSKDGSIIVDDHQQTSLPGLYSIGDVVEALNQIAVGFGHAAIASTAIHNAMRAEAGQLLERV